MLLTFLLPLRLRQWKRTSSDMGVGLWLALLALAAVPALKVYAYAQSPAGGVVVALVGGLGLAGIHRMRRDRGFLQHLTDHPARVMAAEYLVFSLPVSLLLAAALNPVALLVWWLLCVGIAFLPNGKPGESAGSLWNGWIPDGVFEWKAGWRRQGWMLAFFYLAAWAVVWAPWASLLLLWMFTGMLSQFYVENEPLNLLFRDELPPKRFLVQKIKHHVGLGALLTLPPVAVYTVLHPEHWNIAAAFALLNTLQLYDFVVGKYARFHPGVRVQSGSLTTSLVTLGVVVPFLAPLVPIFCVRDTVLALRRLKPYLNHYHA